MSQIDLEDAKSDTSLSAGLDLEESELISDPVSSAQTDSDRKNYSLIRLSTIARGMLDDTKIKKADDHLYWSGRFHSLFSMTGFVVGLGNIWRFPYLVYKNGGVVFFIPYFVMLLFIGFPLFYLEVALGQFSSKANLHFLDCVPLLKGLGLAFLIINTVTTILYLMELTYAFHYLIDSFATPYPWTVCNFEHLPPCKSSDQIENGRCFQNNICNDQLVLTEYYLNKGVLNISSGIAETGQVQKPLLWKYLVMWIILGIFTRKSISVVGKVNFAISFYPYLALVVLLLYGLTLDGAVDGIYFFFEPKFKILVETSVWQDAAEQVFFSLGLCTGGLTTLASFNVFENNCFTDCCLVILIDTFTSIYSGVTMFAVIGSVAKHNHLFISDIIRSGHDLAFITYPYGIASNHGHRVLLIIFFLMLIIIGLESMLGSVEVVLCTIERSDGPMTRGRKRVYSIIAICTSFFLMGIIFTVQAGSYWQEIFSTYVEAGLVSFPAAVAEVLVIAHLYGANRFAEDIEMMHKTKPGTLTILLWSYLTPLTLAVLTIMRYVQYEPLSARDTHTWWADMYGWFDLFAIAGVIPAWAVYEVYNRKGTLQERVRNAVQPNKDWRPLLDEHCTGKYAPLIKNKPIENQDEEAVEYFSVA